MRTDVLAVLPFLALLACSGHGQDDQTDASGPTKFVRMTPNPKAKNEGKLEVAVVRYSNKDGVSVDLVSAVHIADAAHYADLNRLFTGYESLLYELVAEEGTRPKPSRKAAGGLSLLQRAMKDGLDLEFQLDKVDYQPKNFVHADMTPGEFQQVSEERGESILTLMMRAMRTEFARQGEIKQKKGEKWDLVTAFQKGEGRHLLRWSLAQQIEGIERVAAGFSGEDGESVLVEGRNKKAMKVLARVLEDGDRSIGIYYGAAHMPDFEKRLIALGFQRRKVDWMTAWDLTKRPDPERYKSSRRKKKDAKVDKDG